MLNNYNTFQKLQKKLDNDKQFSEKFYVEMFNAIFPYNDGKDLIKFSKPILFTLFNDIQNKALDKYRRLKNE